MLQAAINDPLVPKAHNSECQNLLFHLDLDIKPAKSRLKLVGGFLFLAPSALMG